jgi:hypothetical protein
MKDDKKILDKFDDFIASAIDGGLVVNGDCHKKWPKFVTIY